MVEYLNAGPSPARLSNWKASGSSERRFPREWDKNTFMSGGTERAGQLTLLPFDYQTSITEDDLIADESCSLRVSALCGR